MSYYFEDGKMHFCKGYFDPNPKKISLGEFIMETKRLNMLTESLFFAYMDRYVPGDEVYLDEE